MQDQYVSKVFDIDYTPSRKKLREARVISEVEAIEHLKLSEKTDAYQRNRFPGKDFESYQRFKSFKSTRFIVIVYL